jgi:hypothetical protein
MGFVPTGVIPEYAGERENALIGWGVGFELKTPIYVNEGTFSTTPYRIQWKNGHSSNRNTYNQL